MSARSLSPAQRERQRDEHRDRGRYARVNPCYVCDRSAGVNYWSHPLTDCLDAEGIGFGDLGLVLCSRCAKATQEISTVRGFLQHMQAFLGAACPPWVGARLAALAPALAVRRCAFGCGMPAAEGDIYCQPCRSGVQP